MEGAKTEKRTTYFDEKDLNIHLRGIILNHALNLEFHSKDIIFCILRTLKDDLKTLGNQSSSLSYKTKIDILYDLEEITSEQYSDLLKQMEIRNQFIHNYDVNTFLDLIEIKPEFKIYLDKRYKKDEIENLELRYYNSYLDLYNHCSAWLIMLRQQFNKGITKAFERFIDNMLISQFDEVLEITDNKYLVHETELERLFNFSAVAGAIPEPITTYKLLLKVALAEKALEIASTIQEPEIIKKALSLKHSTADQLAELRQSKKKDTDK